MNVVLDHSLDIELYRKMRLIRRFEERAAEQLFTYLKAPVARVTRADVPVPFSIALDQLVLPSAAQLEEAIRRILDTTSTKEKGRAA